MNAAEAKIEQGSFDPSSYNAPLLEAFPDLSDKKMLKKAAKRLIVEAQGADIMLPEDERKCLMTVGKKLISYRSDPNWPQSMMQALFDEFGTKKKAEKKAAAVAATVKCPANEGLVEAFYELSTLEFKHGVQMKAIAYKKAGGVIADFDFEVTEENVKGLQYKKLKRKSGDVIKGYKGIGKGSIAKMTEFLETGVFEKTAEYKARL